MPLSETTPDSDLLSCLRRYTEEQLSMLKHMLQYYKETADLGLEYRGDRRNADINNPNCTLGLAAYSNSAHEDNTERKLTAGYVIFMAGGVVSFKSYQRRLVTFSSTESEYIAMTYATKEIPGYSAFLASSDISLTTSARSIFERITSRL
jgi:hypothetical protein